MVAGAGTGDSIVFLARQLQHTNAEIVYLDMSSASMEIAKKRCEIHGLNNVSWVLDSLLNAPDLGLGKFDYIQCSGVLHHLKEPQKGLDALSACLKEDGALAIMLYAKYGRIGVYIMQDLMRTIDGGGDEIEEKLEDCKKLIETVPKVNTLFHQAKEDNKSDIYDFGDIGIYDLFLHSQDRPYTVPEIFEFVEASRLHFCTFVTSHLHFGSILYMPQFYIQDPALKTKIQKKPLKDQYAIAELLYGRMKKHSFYVCKQPNSKAEIHDLHMVPCLHMSADKKEHHRLLQWVRDSAEIVSIEIKPEITEVPININRPKTRYTEAIFEAWDSQRTTEEILHYAMQKLGIGPLEAYMEKEIYTEFAAWFKLFNMMERAFLRHKSVLPFKKMHEITPK